MSLFPFRGQGPETHTDGHLHVQTANCTAHTSFALQHWYPFKVNEWIHKCFNLLSNLVRKCLARDERGVDGQETNLKDEGIEGGRFVSVHGRKAAESSQLQHWWWLSLTISSGHEPLKTQPASLPFLSSLSIQANWPVRKHPHVPYLSARTWSFWTVTHMFNKSVHHSSIPNSIKQNQSPPIRQTKKKEKSRGLPVPRLLKLPSNPFIPASRICCGCVCARWLVVSSYFRRRKNFLPPSLFVARNIGNTSHITHHPNLSFQGKNV
ncbi:hypothetical protein B0H63DRAFT_476492 [Podospora didyma]|uniref:Uncharacterized protein n=1 Tax=Podospora didyma TaxID=330526 RepID=A0AAE0NHR6_9PEZI|nr:hypothetical protein B0H63DRAFT_476492 [Podospora didyma]